MSVVPATLGEPTAEAISAPRARIREKIDYIEYFRAIAIILIVTGHTFELAWRDNFGADPLRSGAWMTVPAAIILGGTAFFVFISGFLYRHVFHGRMAYSDFMTKKALAVGLPYLLLATPIALSQLFYADFHVVVMKFGEPFRESAFLGVVDQLLTGSMMIAYWYIPFVFLVFLASPLFDRFIRLRAGLRFGIFAVSLAVAFWIHRPLENLNPVMSFFYFANLYLAGILFWEYRKPLIAALQTPLVIAALAVATLGLAYLQGVVMHDAANLERGPHDGWMPLAFDWMLAQKYVAIPLFLGVLARWGHYLGGALSYIASISFGLFFVHGPVISVMIHLPRDYFPVPSNPMEGLALYGIPVLVISGLIVNAVKALLGKRSRYLIGC